MFTPKSAWKAVVWTHHVPGVTPRLWWRWPPAPLTEPFLWLGYSLVQYLLPLLAALHCNFWSCCSWLTRIIEASLFRAQATSHCQQQQAGADHKLSVPLLLSELQIRIPALLSTCCNMWFLEMLPNNNKKSLNRAQQEPKVMKYVPLFSLGLLPRPNVALSFTVFRSYCWLIFHRTDSIYPCSLFYSPLPFPLTIPPFLSRNRLPKASFPKGTFKWTIVHS